MLPPAASMRLDCFLFARNQLIILLDEQCRDRNRKPETPLRRCPTCFKVILLMLCPSVLPPLSKDKVHFGRLEH
jgi:hypothetical protein